ncbi:MAG: TRAP transporter small permease [Sedimentibacter sp.]
MKKWFDKLEENIIAVTLSLMLVFIFASVIFRYFKLGAFTWAEEASRYLMVWFSVAGISLGIKTNSHLGLNFFVSKFSEEKQRIFFYVQAALVTLFGVLMAIYSSSLVKNLFINPQLSPSLELPMWIPYSALIFGSVMIIIRNLQNICKFRTNKIEIEVHNI